jgi:hypothetical protein
MGQEGHCEVLDRARIRFGRMVHTGQVSVRVRTSARCSLYQDIGQFGCGSFYFGSSS